MRFFIRFFTTNKTYSQKFTVLEQKIAELESSLKEVKSKRDPPLNPKKETESIPVIHVTHLTVENINIEKLDYANNFGQLGIKELTGKLNIGTSYEGEFSKEISDKVNQYVDEKLGKKTKVNMRAKKDK
ncbi:hypothetical protein [Neobacillus sp. LXY-1]|uniref:hypothetical protein n=1 Tax=Neobacillus sp. LXY-1 TaxID=3379133 RepID=UPI003EE30754